MARRRLVRRPRPIVLVIHHWQTGKTTRYIDRRRKALKPGKRRSKNRNIYYEHRRNRSDLGRWE